MKLNLYLTVITFLMISGCSTIVDVSTEEYARMMLDGTWKSVCVNEEGSPVSHISEFSFPFETDKSKIIINNELFAGQDCQTENRLFKFEQQGTMLIETDASGDLVPYNAIYDEDSIRANMFVIVLSQTSVTPYADDAIIMLESAYSGCDVSFTKQTVTDTSKCEQPVWAINANTTAYAAFYMLNEKQLLAGGMYISKIEAINDFNENPLFPFTKQ